MYFEQFMEQVVNEFWRKAVSLSCHP